ncbi:MAG: hypothetical protein JWN61_2703 [Pseudonocardiales bacterium]|nr:hypothetical protein [Pseudonocardiales bacterium]
MGSPASADPQADLLRDLATEYEQHDPIAPDRRRLAHLAVLARPIEAGARVEGARMERAPGVTGSGLRQLLRDAQAEPQHWFPNLTELTEMTRGPSGVTVSTSAAGTVAPERESLLVRLSDAGEFLMICGHASKPVPGATDAAINPRQLADLVHQLLDVIAAASRGALGHDGDWRIGVRIAGLQGLLCSDVYAADSYLWQRYSPYPRDLYHQATLIDQAQLQGARPRVVQLLLGELCRELGVAVFPYARRAELAV